MAKKVESVTYEIVSPAYSADYSFGLDMGGGKIKKVQFVCGKYTCDDAEMNKRLFWMSDSKGSVFKREGSNQQSAVSNQG